MKNLLEDKKYIEKTFDLENLKLKKPITCPEGITDFSSKEPFRFCAVCKVKGCDLYWLERFIREGKHYDYMGGE